MRGKTKTPIHTLCRGLIATLVVIGRAQADSLPIPDGVYVTKPQLCEDLRKAELEMIDFEVSKGGAAFGYPESSCLVAEVTKVRQNRYRVVGDCDEAGDIWQSAFFLDVVSGDEISIDGAAHSLCKAGSTLTSMAHSSAWNEFIEQPVEQLCWLQTTRDTRYYWWETDSEDFEDLVPTDPMANGTEIPVYGRKVMSPLLVRMVYALSPSFGATSYPWTTLSLSGDAVPVVRRCTEGELPGDRRCTRTTVLRWLGRVGHLSRRSA